MIPWRF